MTLSREEWEELYTRAKAECDWDRGYCYHCSAGGTCPKRGLPPVPPPTSPPPATTGTLKD